MKEKRLTAKQERFCHEYLIDGNATQAAIRAGYEKRNADVVGPRLLGKVGIKKRIEDLNRKRLDRVDIRAEDILRELRRVAFYDLRDLTEGEGNIRPIHELPEDIRRALGGVKIEALFAGRGEERLQIGQIRDYHLLDKVRCLIKLGEHVGLFRKTLELTDSTTAERLRRARERARSKRDGEGGASA